MKSIFEFLDYKLFLKAIVKAKVASITSLSVSAECQRSHLSRVLRGKMQLTMDQAHSISLFLNMKQNESEYFKSLVEIQRANSSKYRQYLVTQATNLRQNYLDLRHHVTNQSLMSPQPNTNSDYQTYLRSWIFSAIHLAVSIPNLQSAEALSANFKLQKETVLNALSLLERLDLVKNENGRWRWNKGDQHITRDNPLLTAHHLNWIHKATDSIYKNDSESIHYSLVQSLSAADFEKLKNLISAWVNEFGKIAGPSNPEQLACIRFDFFKVS